MGNGWAVGRTAEARCPGQVMALRDPPGDDPDMPQTRPAVSGSSALFGDTVLGTTLVAAGLWFVWLAVSTPLVAALSVGRLTPDPSDLRTILAWAAALSAPLVLVLVGTERLARLVAAVRGGTWRRSRGDLFSPLPMDVRVARSVSLGDGRSPVTVLIGAFGLAVVHAAGPGPWDRWDDPRELVTRDAERVRRWLMQHDIDFVVRIYAAVVTGGDVADLPRTTACAVLQPEQLPAWVASLQRQRSLVTGRRDRIERALVGEPGLEPGTSGI